MTKLSTENKSEKDIGGSARPIRPKSGKKAAKASASGTSPFTRVKLKPQRPVPTVHPGSNVTGPRSSHVEGKNVICVTRATKLGAYLRRCKSLILDDGFKTLHLYALGAAIPHLLLLVTSLPECLPFGPQDIHSEITTGTTVCMDEIHPEDEEEDVELKSRNKSSLQVKITITGGEPAAPNKS
ncbi:hypothetical protein CTheo_1323 [Ceratobasidium theobromae]|uniref:Uncharacterized protein n=1 Tax=Ceratobasidium theobromae TaxID=1582974 RepID=A0A5N5QU03_9AGAM|nr:hypothetical protein CTheo_1323 [Ceratobasidium theobromae]